LADKHAILVSKKETMNFIRKILLRLELKRVHRRKCTAIHQQEYETAALMKARDAEIRAELEG
jgi:hypothetical protein